MPARQACRSPGGVRAAGRARRARACRVRSGTCGLGRAGPASERHLRLLGPQPLTRAGPLGLEIIRRKLQSEPQPLIDACARRSLAAAHWFTARVSLTEPRYAVSEAPSRSRSSETTSGQFGAHDPAMRQIRASHRSNLHHNLLHRSNQQYIRCTNRLPWLPLKRTRVAKTRPRSLRSVSRKPARVASSPGGRPRPVREPCAVAPCRSARRSPRAGGALANRAFHQASRRGRSHRQEVPPPPQQRRNLASPERGFAHEPDARAPRGRSRSTPSLLATPRTLLSHFSRRRKGRPGPCRSRRSEDVRAPGRTKRSLLRRLRVGALPHVLACDTADCQPAAHEQGRWALCVLCDPWDERPRHARAALPCCLQTGCRDRSHGSRTTCRNEGLARHHARIAVRILALHRRSGHRLHWDPRA